MGTLINLVGKTFGRLTVMTHVPRVPGSNDDSKWVCLCECNKQTIVGGKCLRYGGTKSCGCWNSDYRIARNKDEHALPLGVSSWRGLLSRYKREAGKRNFVWELSESDFNELVHGNCYYCGDIPKQSYISNKKSNGAFIYNGIDRRNNRKGYTVINCVSCCGPCNTMKSDLKECQFFEHINKIFTYTKNTKNQSKVVIFPQTVSHKRPLAPIVSAVRYVVRTYKKAAHDRFLTWKLTEHEIANLIFNCCSYCGSEPSRPIITWNKTSQFYCNGIDRVNNNVGYTLQNSTTCCKTCNRMKSNMTQIEFYGRINKIAHGRKAQAQTAAGGN